MFLYLHLTESVDMEPADMRAYVLNMHYLVPGTGQGLRVCDTTAGLYRTVSENIKLDYIFSHFEEF